MKRPARLVLDRPRYTLEVLFVLAALFTVPTIAAGQLAPLERAALIALYNSTNGDDWTDNSNWRNSDDSDFNDPGTECTWFGVTCSEYIPTWMLQLKDNNLVGVLPAEIGDLRLVRDLDLSFNKLSGPLPLELGELDELDSLDLSFNELTGEIPASLGFLNEAYEIVLSDNQLSGSIPGELAASGRLYRLRLDRNRLSGPLPPELGGLPHFMSFTAQGNMLSGPIPSEWAALIDMTFFYCSMSWNALWVDDPAVQDFIDAEHGTNPGFAESQTVPPGNLTIESVHDHTVWLTWDPILYLTDEGGTIAYVSEAGSDSRSEAGFTSDKSTLRLPVTGLDPGTTFEFAVASFTEPHPGNANLVVSEPSYAVMATTSQIGCAAPSIAIDSQPGSTYRLTVGGAFDSYEWSTGETTESIVVTPAAPISIWVEVTSAGPCDEAARVIIDPLFLFSDGFESSDTSGWSSTIE